MSAKVDAASFDRSYVAGACLYRRSRFLVTQFDAVCGHTFRYGDGDALSHRQKSTAAGCASQGYV